MYQVFTYEVFFPTIFWVLFTLVHGSSRDRVVSIKGVYFASSNPTVARFVDEKKKEGRSGLDV